MNIDKMLESKTGKIILYCFYAFILLVLCTFGLIIFGLFLCLFFINVSFFISIFIIGVILFLFLNNFFHFKEIELKLKSSFYFMLEKIVLIAAYVILYFFLIICIIIENLFKDNG